MLSKLYKLIGTSNDRTVKKLHKEVRKINALEKMMQGLTLEELKDKTTQFKEALSNGQNIDEIIYEAFAVVRETAFRVIGQRHYDVQLIGGLVLNKGNIAEMRTGEGKTLVATLPAYLNALTGNSVHIITVNDYLAKRDAEWMGRVFRALGLTVGYIVSGIEDIKRKEAYECDILYITNNELGFDLLRDNMKYSREQQVLRKLHYAIVDEVDSILIDEARTPLIISGPVTQNTDIYHVINKIVAQLTEEHYEKDEKNRSITLTEEGIEFVEKYMRDNNIIKSDTALYDVENLMLVHNLNQSLKAYQFFKSDAQYIVKDNKVLIIDEFTGRIMDGRRYSDGLHQAIEAKEGVEIQNENQTLASITFQNLFRMYDKLSGMTGTALTEAKEFKDIYKMNVISIPTHKPVTRQDFDDKIYGTQKEKYDAILENIKAAHEKGQPVLVGTVNIDKSEEISTLLKKSKIKHNVLNAKFHEQEAHIIAQAGRYKAVTIATNMAGRGTDIMLGGNVEMMISELDKDKLTDEQYKSEKDKITEIVKEEKAKVLDIGGLCIIGTERHESRRIDNQLRGRSGRQGDPGITRFFLSLEDDLMRIFASDRISNILRTLGLKNGEDIQHPIISKSLEKAQRKVESHNYEIRKNLLRFDDVMNQQRNIIYEQRNDVMDAKDMDPFINRMLNHVIENLISQFIKPNTYREEWNITELLGEYHRVTSVHIDPEIVKNMDGDEKEIQKMLFDKAKKLYDDKKVKYGVDPLNDIMRYVMLTTIDQTWKEHLHSLDHMRSAISLRAYGQKNPLNEYKQEAFQLFETMFYSIQELFIDRVCHIHIAEKGSNEELYNTNNMLENAYTNEQDLQNNRSKNLDASMLMEPTKQMPKKHVDPSERDPSNPDSWGKVARNESCPCGSGKKYKHCHG